MLTCWCAIRRAMMAAIFTVLFAEAALAQAQGCVTTHWRAATEQMQTYLTAQAEPVADRQEPDRGCILCHGDAGKLIGMVKAPEAPPEDGCASAPSRPPFLGSFVNAGFPDTLHGQLGCTTCHGGDVAAVDMSAHTGLKDANASCTLCHADQVEKFETSLHNTLGGMAHALTLRSGEENLAALDHAWTNDCASCHADCGDCHLSLPDAVGGGLIKGHTIMARAPMEDSCALCHGSRAGGEYLGQFEGIARGYPFRERACTASTATRTTCMATAQLYETRWQVAGRAQCTDCHKPETQVAIPGHDDHHADVACQVCHAQPYQNCFDCHTGEEDGKYFRRAGVQGTAAETRPKHRPRLSLWHRRRCATTRWRGTVSTIWARTCCPISTRIPPGKPPPRTTSDGSPRRTPDAKTAMPTRPVSVLRKTSTRTAPPQIPARS